MSRRAKRQRRSSVSRRWTTVRVSLLCATGHRMVAGERVLMIRAGWKRLKVCEGCAKEHYGMTPPIPEPFTVHPGDVHDFKTRQVGEVD